ncbi:hypothetical protein [Legionella cincinnatiensis]|uniref:Uncharacterized protein n=1 Tax=Legionella cincinnatiensis TaxID=28085 RepID=A0A378ITR4_9GAMM|nr:hypothetical protein [Legionella cincinnatiensis]KTC82121.1 hypothetical protein Lcin_3191 [Legionella cincinnatiensis]STX35404.1 Uncharacterised protein [Legionella cincinnatiensis]
MKKLIVSFFILGASVSYAATQTDMNSKWVCTTNASSSDNPSDKAADDKMANTQGPAAQSFAFAAQNCRDCTKITCEAKD